MSTNKAIIDTEPNITRGYFIYGFDTTEDATESLGKLKKSLPNDPITKSLKLGVVNGNHDPSKPADSSNPKFVAIA
jgi:hypothetical protein